MAENHHIEDFFRKRLASHEFPYHEEDWLKLERKLDISSLASSDAAVTHFSLRSLIIIAAGLAAAFILGWLTRELISDKKNEQTTVLHQSESVSSEPEFQKENNPASSLKNPVNKEIGAKASENKESDIVAKEDNLDESGGEYSYESITQPSAAFNYAIPGYAIPETDTNPETVTRINEETVTINRSSEEWQFPSLSMINNNLVTNQSIDLPFLPVSEKTSSGVFNTRGSRWSIGLLLAPDFNSTGIRQRKTFSPVAGGLISYKLSKRWSLSARILYNQKKYSSKGDYYNVPYGYWSERTNGIIPDNIDGSCRVLDVPILLSYRFYNRQRISLTVSAGPGSYFLLDEKYEFTFKQDNPGAASQWKTTEDSRVLFGVANFALGLEIQTSPRISFAVEPYLKLPLKQMGWAKVNLSGMGLSFSMKYHF